MGRSSAPRYVGSATALALLALTPTAHAAYLKGPLLLCDQGSFFVGGIPKTTFYAASSTPAAAPSQITIGQMYVQFQIPALLSRKWPLIMVHGSTHSGACVEATPQGTEGWAPYAVRKGLLSTYVVDQPGRGRSGNDESRIHEGKAMLIANNAAGGSLIPDIGRITDNGSYTSWFGHLVQPGTATTCTDIRTCELKPHGWRPDDPSTPDIHPNPAGYGPAWTFTQTKFITPANLDYTNSGTFGPAPYGPAAAYQQHYYRQLVPNYEVTLPASICPSCTPTTVAPANTFSPRDLATLVEKLGGAIVAVHSQSGFQGYHMARILKEDGKLGLLKGLIDIEGSCNLAQVGLTAPDFDSVPTLTVKGDYRPDADPSLPCYNEIHARRLAGQGSAAATYIALDSPSFKGKFNGVTHMMMDGSNNLQVMDVILDWAEKNISNPIQLGRCPSPPPPS